MATVYILLRFASFWITCKEKENINLRVSNFLITKIVSLEHGYQKISVLINKFQGGKADPDGFKRIHEDPSGSKGSRIRFFPLDKEGGRVRPFCGSL